MKTQIWIAVSIYVLVAILRKRLGLEASLYQALQILGVTLFEKTPFCRHFRHSTWKDTPVCPGRWFRLSHGMRSPDRHSRSLLWSGLLLHSFRRKSSD